MNGETRATNGETRVTNGDARRNSAAHAEERERVRQLLSRHGWNATSFQTLEAGFRYWFDGDDACVAYVPTGGAWVVAGAPICAMSRLTEVSARFYAAALAAGKRVAFFAAEERLVAGAGLERTYVGEQPVWDATRWRDNVQSTKSLREQLRRAHNKGVAVRRVGPDELADGAPLRVA
ncbi:MAG TPA: phosphatidylglycerol lysyltransferase domain-containing protein, partial [Polyangia bacterium]